MKSLKLHITIYFILIWSFSFAQQYTNYTINEGLPSNHVYRITQDYKGFIWIITDKGISKFDGESFKNFTAKDGLPTNDIWNIRITPDNKVWYFSKANKLGYILNDKVVAFPIKKGKVLHPRYINQSQNTITINDGKNLYSLKNNIWETEKNINIKNSYPFSQKLIYDEPTYSGINLGRDSVFLYRKGEFSKFKIKKGSVDNAYEGGQINDSLFTFINPERYIIQNLLTRKTKATSYKSQNLPKSIKYFRPHFVNNRIQLTAENFVGFLDAGYSIKSIVTIPEKLNSHFSFIDKKGNIWSATFNKGVFMLPKEKQQVQILVKGKKVQQLLVVKNKVYAGIYKEGFFNLKNTEQPIIKNDGFQYSITNIDTLKTTFFCSEYDIHIYKNKQIIKLNLPEETPNKNTFSRKLIEFKGYLYGNNSFGIRKINPKKITSIKNHQLYGISSFSKTKKHLFTGNQSGLFLFKNDTFIKLNQHSIFKKPILCQKQLNNHFIVVGLDGYGAYITDSEKIIPIKNSENYSIQNILVDKNKNIWLATQKGVHKATKQEGYTITKSFYKSDGLLSNNTSCIAIKNDSLYIGTDIGISVISLKQKQVNQLQSVYLKSILANGVSYTKDSISLPYKKNSFISASFGAINYSNQQNLIYQYKLEPIQSNWITTVTPEINFTDLKPNTYSLQLKASNHHKNQKIKTIVLKITPLWHQQIWFKLFITFGLLGLFFITVWYLSKKNQHKKNKKLLQEKQLSEIQLKALRSQMNPHFVFNSLAAIQYYINENNFEASEKYLVKFSKLIRQFFELSKETTITLSEEIKLLTSYLEIEKLRFKEKLEFHINIENNLDSVSTKIPTMLLQPIVENAVNHGVFNKLDTGTITIKFSKVDINTYKVFIIDDGVGFVNTKSKNKKIRSSSVLKERLTYLNTLEKWDVKYFTEELYPEKEEKGNISTFIIKHK